MLQRMRDEIPGFSSWYHPDPTRRRGRKPVVRGEKKQDLLAKLGAREWGMCIAVTCHLGACLGARKSDLPPDGELPMERIKNAVGALACYAAVYSQYLVDLMTTGLMPQQNDNGDLALFLYAIDSDHVVVTTEKRWANIATRAGHPVRLIRLRKV